MTTVIRQVSIKKRAKPHEIWSLDYKNNPLKSIEAIDYEVLK